MFNLSKINNFEYLEERCVELIEFYQPEVFRDSLEKASKSMNNMLSKEEAKLYIFTLIARLRTYHIEFLAWHERPQYLPLILECVKKYSEKYGK
jgi:hypothetical protein